MIAAIGCEEKGSGGSSSPDGAKIEFQLPSNIQPTNNLVLNKNISEPTRADVNQYSISTYRIILTCDNPVYSKEIASASPGQTITFDMLDLGVYSLVIEGKDESGKVIYSGTNEFDLSNISGSPEINLEIADGNTGTSSISISVVIETPDSDENIPVSNISLNETNKIIEIGLTAELYATIEPSNATNQNVNWTSSDNSVATVADGVVSALKGGKSTITAKSDDGHFSAECEITVVVICEGSYTITNETELNDISSCNVIKGSLTIESATITNLDVLTNLTSIGAYLILKNNDALINLNGLSGLTSVSTGIIISYNAALTSTAGLSNMTRSYLNGDLDVGSNPLLINLEGLNNITSVSALRIQNNIKLESIDGLSGISNVNHDLFIIGNESLTDITGLSNLTSITGLFKILDNVALTNLNGLNKLTSVGSGTAIERNFALENLTGLNSLTSIEGYLKILANLALKNLNGLEKLTHIEDSLNITYNESLPTCEANNFLNQLIGFTGTTTISDNDDAGTCD